MGAEMKVAIHAIMRDVYEPYLTEWLNHHRSIGVDCFFLYDNDSKKSIVESIKDVPFKNKIYVEYCPGVASPANNVQMFSYHKFLNDFSKEFDRVAFIDEDEFIICENGDIKATLSDYLDFPGLALSWRVFGSSGLIKQTPVPQMEKFVYYAPKYLGNINVKSIVDPKLVGSVSNPHVFSYTKENCVTVDKLPLKGAYAIPTYHTAWINHYWTRSLEEWNAKAARGRADNGEARDISMFDDLNVMCTERI
jgi:hypothetical protein